MAGPGPGESPPRPARHLQPQFHARRIHDDAFVERAAIFHDDRVRKARRPRSRSLAGRCARAASRHEQPRRFERPAALQLAARRCRRRSGAGNMRGLIRRLSSIAYTPVYATYAPATSTTRRPSIERLRLVITNGINLGFNTYRTRKTRCPATMANDGSSHAGHTLSGFGKRRFLAEKPQGIQNPNRLTRPSRLIGAFILVITERVWKLIFIFIGAFLRRTIISSLLQRPHTQHDSFAR
jgi:hypothetical protein